MPLSEIGILIGLSQEQSFLVEEKSLVAKLYTDEKCAFIVLATLPNATPIPSAGQQVYGNLKPEVWEWYADVLKEVSSPLLVAENRKFCAVSDSS